MEVFELKDVKSDTSSQFCDSSMEQATNLDNKDNGDHMEELFSYIEPTYPSKPKPAFSEFRDMH